MSKLPAQLSLALGKRELHTGECEQAGGFKQEANLRGIHSEPMFPLLNSSC